LFGTRFDKNKYFLTQLRYMQISLSDSSGFNWSIRLGEKLSTLHVTTFSTAGRHGILATPEGNESDAGVIATHASEAGRAKAPATPRVRPEAPAL